MREKIEELLKKKRKSKGELIEVLNLTYNGLNNKIKNDTFKGYEIEVLEKFFNVEKGYFSNENSAVQTKSETSKWEIPGEQYYKRIEQKYIEAMEENQILWRALMSNGIKVDLGKLNVSGLHGVKIFCSY